MSYADNSTLKKYLPLGSKIHGNAEDEPSANWHAEILRSDDRSLALKTDNARKRNSASVGRAVNSKASTRCSRSSKLNMTSICIGEVSRQRHNNAVNTEPPWSRVHNSEPLCGGPVTADVIYAAASHVEQTLRRLLRDTQAISTPLCLPLYWQQSFALSLLIGIAKNVQKSDFQNPGSRFFKVALGSANKEHTGVLISFMQVQVSICT